VVVTDIDSVDKPFMRALFYIALSRAIHQLFILVNNEANPMFCSNCLREHRLTNPSSTGRV
jgi:hypothetical protein